MKHLLYSALPLLGFGLAGCATVQPRQAFPEVSGSIEKRTGNQATWNQGTAADQQAADALRRLLVCNLTADSAAQVALLNNPTAQATYEELGIAQAELVQAGLLTNPIFSALLRFPDGGQGRPNLELSVSENFIELLSLSLKKKVAAAAYDGAKARVGAQIVDLVADVHIAFYKAQGDRQMLEMRRALLSAANASLDAVQRLRDAGNTTELALFNERAIQAQASLDLLTAEAETAHNLEKLAVLLGLADPQRLKFANRLPDLPSDDEQPANAEMTALHQRLDYAAAMAGWRAVRSAYGLTRQFNWLNDAELTVDGEHELDGSWVTGPGIAIPVPIFDDGTAAISAASGRVRAAQDRLAALSIRIRSDVRCARTDLQAARERAELYRTKVLPLRHQITQQTQLQFNGMLVSVFQLLEAKRAEVDAGRTYIQAVLDYWIARTALERAMGGRLIAMPATMPATIQQTN